MAFGYAHGAIQWDTTDALNAIKTVSGLSFAPKAIKVWTMGIGSATDVSLSTSVHLRYCIGFAVSTSSRRCVAVQDQDAAGTSVCTTGFRNDAIVMTLTSTPAADGLLDVNSFTSDGFTLIVDDVTPVNITVFWEAWGGDDITVAVTGDIAEPAANGDQDYTVTGFTSNGAGQVVMFAGCQATAASPTAARNDSSIMHGWATGLSGTAPAENNVMLTGADDASGTMDGSFYVLDGECIAMGVVATPTSVTARASLTQWNTDGFRLNWTRAVTNRRYIYLAIKGGQWKAGIAVIDVRTTNATATVSGLPFQPVGISIMSAGQSESTSGTGGSEVHGSLGAIGPTTSDCRCMGVYSPNVNACEINSRLEYDQCLVVVDDAAAGASIDINAINSDGFQLITDTGDADVGSATAFIAYLACAGNAVVTTPPPKPTVLLQAVQRAAFY